MYMPAHFSENRFDVLRNLIHQHPLASMVSMEADGMTANHIPFIITPPTTEAPFGKLLGHVARANPVWQNRESVLLIFRDRRLTLHLAGTKKKTDRRGCSDIQLRGCSCAWKNQRGGRQRTISELTHTTHRAF